MGTHPLMPEQLQRQPHTHTHTHKNNDSDTDFHLYLLGRSCFSLGFDSHFHSHLSLSKDSCEKRTTYDHFFLEMSAYNLAEFLMGILCAFDMHLFR